MKKLFSLYLRYLKIAGKQKGKYFSSWVLVLTLLIVLNSSTFIMGYLIDNVSSDADQLRNIVGLIAIVLGLPLLLEPLVFFLKSRIYSKIVTDVTTQVYYNVLKQDYEFHVNRQTGKLISIILNSNQPFDMFLWRFEWFFLENLLSLLIPITLITVISPQIGISICIVILIMMPLAMWSLRVNINRRRLLKDEDYKKNNAIIDGVSNFETVRSFGTENRERGVFYERMKLNERAMNHYQDSFRLIDFVSRLLSIAVFIVGAGLTVYYFEREVLTLGFVVVIISYLINMSRGFMNLVFSLRDIFKELPVVEDFYELYDAQESVIEVEKPHYLQDPRGSIEFRDVSFSYKDDQRLIQKLNIKVEPEQNIALVGASGGGKSTLTRLLMRYYDVGQGEILVDGVNVKNLAMDNLRSIIGIVPQEPVMFNRSIFYNVGYALNGIDDDAPDLAPQVIEACKQAQVHDFITTLPQGYNTFVGERGIKLSGGQKQRLAIARILLKNPKIVIFDEATSMLDSESEKAIQEAFKVLSKDKTVIIIAHRLSTVIHCDNIIVIDSGSVLEQGTHEQLIQNESMYAKLWKIQSGGFKK